MTMKRIVAAAAAMMLASAGGASAQDMAARPGLFFGLEGQFGYTFAEPSHAFFAVYGVSDPADGARYLNVDTALSGRAEWGGIAATDRTLIRFETVLAGWMGAAALAESPDRIVPVYHAPGGPSYGGIMLVCGAVETCAEASLSRRFWEISQGTQFGFGGEGGGAFWIGPRAFYARMAEAWRTDIIVEGGSGGAETFDRRGTLDAHALGGLIAVEATVGLARHLSLTAEGGIGYYRLGGLSATDLFVNGAAYGGGGTEVTAIAASGYRAQFGVGFAYAMNPSVEIGIVGRADYWSAYPTLYWPDSATDFGVENGIATERMIHLTGGLSLTIRTGGP